MTDAQINLAFLRSLSKNYEIFQQAMGDQPYTMKPGELYAKVRALAESKEGPQNIHERHHQATALALRITDDRSLDQRISNDIGLRNGGFKGGFRGGNGGGFRGSGGISKTTLSTQISSRPPISTETKPVDSVKRLATFSKSAGS